MAVDVAATPTAGDESGTEANKSFSTAGTTDGTMRWFQHPIHDLTNKNIDPNEPQPRHVFRLWANVNIFSFVRMFLILYERLHRLKMSEQSCRDTVRTAMKPKPAIELGIMDKLPSDYFGDTSANANYYSQMLTKFAQVLEGEMEFQTDGVEECLRRFYLQAGYPLYQFEKMVIALAKFGGQVVIQEGGNKEKSWEIIGLWKKDRLKGDESSAVQATDYRKGVERLMGSAPAEMYGVDWVSSALKLPQLLSTHQKPLAHFLCTGPSREDCAHVPR
jgi:paired amphipathic helix protein Sin3a